MRVLFALVKIPSKQSSNVPIATAVRIAFHYKEEEMMRVPGGTMILPKRQRHYFSLTLLSISSISLKRFPTKMAVTTTTIKQIKNHRIVRLVVISDTHGYHDLLTPEMPAGDVLIHCGDFADRDSEENVIEFVKWISKQDQYAEKFVIDGKP